MYQVILINDEKKNRNYYQSYVESNDNSLGNITVEELPPFADPNKARSCYWDTAKKVFVFDEEKYEEIKTKIEEDKIEILTNLSDSAKLSLFAKAIKVESAPNENGRMLPPKEGYKWEQVCNIVNGQPTICWVLNEDPDYEKKNDGSDYSKAIEWRDGESITEGLWYNVGDDLIWQAIKSGVPTSGEDKEYFDIP